MYSNHYFVEITIKERRKQFLEEAERFYLLKVAKTTEAKKRKRIFGMIRKFF